MQEVTLPVTTRSRLTQAAALIAGRVAPAAFLLALTIAVHWKLALTNQYTWLDGLDLTRQVLPWFQEEAAQIRHTRLPVYDMHHWGGQSLIGQDQPGVLFPLNWILFLLHQWQGRIALQFFNWYYVLIHYFAALFCYLLARDIGLSRFASIVAGLSFGCSGVLGNLTWPQMLNSGIWAPVILMFTLRALQGRRPLFSIAAAGAITGLSFFGGHHQLPSFVILTVGFLMLFFAWSERTPYRSVALLAPLYLIFTFLAGAPQLLPSYEYWSRALRWVGSAHALTWHEKVPYIVFDQFSVHPTSLLGLFYPGSFPSAMHFVGLTIFSLAILAAALGWRSRMIAPFAGVAILGILFSLGKYSVFHGLFYSVLPFLDKSRNAAFAMFVVDLALAILAGFGIDFLLCELESVPLRWLTNSLLSLGALLAVGILARGMFQGDKMFEDIPFAYLTLSAVLLGAILRAFQRKRLPVRAFMACVLGLVLFEIGSVTLREAPHIEQGWPQLAQLSRHDDLNIVLHAQPGLFRVERNEEDIQYNFGDWYALDEYRGYAGVTRNIHAMSGEPAARALLGVSFYLGRQPNNSENQPMYSGQSGVNIYRVPGAFPRAWSVHTVESVSSEVEARRQLNLPLQELAAKSFVMGSAPSVEPCGGHDDMRIQQTRNARFSIDANMACKGMVIIGNTFDPGWRAEVDAKPSQVYEAYNFLQGVVVEAGQHRIQLRYRPVTFYWGLCLAAVALAGLAVFARM
jgi:membrane protein YfhO